ncbi:hypothetical protein ILUMI_13574 [Ignelater luminosus]|uniref:DDE Tnp4 domain-containing protein n=1 Tax=Ignelater luminosus TaxID=2038154 RepID=A0A8K0CS23_IGNLU|nr:hypothetical protein ILUMI_13574 [Ignelater luminosus]
MTVEIINMISPFMKQGVYNNKISRELTILAALSFFATGSTQTNLGDNFVLGLSQAMVSRSIKEVTDIMTEHLAPRHIRFPNTANEINRIKEGFFLKHRDSGYPLESWLLTPMVDAQPGTPEARYTLRHSQTKNVIERCNGLLKMRFRCLSKKLLYHPIQVGKIVYAAVVLHNLAIDFNLNDLNDKEPLIIDNDGT